MSNDYVEDREPLDTKAMLEKGFFDKLGNNLKIKPDSHQEKTSETIVKYNTEKLLLNLFEARDGLVDTYSKIGIGAHSQKFVDGINKIGACIRSLGGEVENFDPFAHMSGLQAPNLHKNAKRVIENTIEAYTLGKIEDATISEDGKIITVTFTGRQGNTDYKAVGTLVASRAWVGNEAIEYLYAPTEGRLSVKVFADNGKWVDKSSNYKISWELFENETDFNVMPTEGENKAIQKEGQKENNVENKKEIENSIQNNIDDEDIGDFPIDERS